MKMRRRRRIIHAACLRYIRQSWYCVYFFDEDPYSRLTSPLAVPYPGPQLPLAPSFVGMYRGVNILL